MIDEEDKIAAMQVDLLPDYSVTQVDMHAYGYTWDGGVAYAQKSGVQTLGDGA